MKATITLKDDRGWELVLAPETEVELDIMRAANRGMDVKCEVYSYPEDDGRMRVIVEGKSRIREIKEDKDE
jgi:hypothetical protein